MLFSSGFKTLITAASLSVLFAAPAIAVPVQHDGSIFAASGGGVSFSFIHKSTRNGRGGLIGGNLISGNSQIVGDVSYTWDTGGSGTLATGTTITFDRGPTTVFNNGTFVLDLWTSPSVLTVGQAVDHGSIDGVAVTHDIGGAINFTITQIAGSNFGAVLSDTFIFNENMRMGPINGIGSAGGSPESFNTYIWGETGIFDADDCSFADCGDIQSTFFATSDNRAFGIDLAFSGSPLPVAEPGALALFGIGLIGLGLARRRAQKTHRD